eukprot:1213812-Pyramimonas_sp.AAC.1
MREEQTRRHRARLGNLHQPAVDPSGSSDGRVGRMIADWDRLGSVAFLLRTRKGTGLGLRGEVRRVRKGGPTP